MNPLIPSSDNTRASGTDADAASLCMAAVESENNTRSTTVSFGDGSSGCRDEVDAAGRPLKPLFSSNGSHESVEEVEEPQKPASHRPAAAEHTQTPPLHSQMMDPPVLRADDEDDDRSYRTSSPPPPPGNNCSAAKVNLQMSYSVLWYTSQDTESLFLVSEFGRCGMRVFYFCVCATVAALVRRSMARGNEELEQLALIALIIFLVGSVVSGSGLVFKRREEEKIEEMKERATRQSLTKDRATNRKRSPSERQTPDSDAPPQPERRQGIQQHASPPPTVLLATPRLKLLAVVQEVNSTILTGFVALFFSYIWPTMQSICTYLQEPYDGRQNHDRCPSRLFPFWFFFTMLPVITGRPRFYVTVAANVANLVMLIVHLHLHSVTQTGMALVLIFAFTVLLLTSLLKLADETNHRRRFESSILLRAQEHNIRQQSAALSQFVLDITPKHLRSRLTSNAFQVQVDKSQQATCVLLDVFAVDDVMTSMLPIRSGVAIGMFTAQTAIECERYNLHHIRSLGDVQVLVANLFMKDTTHPRHAVDNAILFCEAVSEFSTLPVRGGIAKGPLMGMPVGHVCIRYDIAGPALVDAQRVLQVCEARCVEVADSGEANSSSSGRGGGMDALGVPIKRMSGSTNSGDQASTSKKLLSSSPLKSSHTVPLGEQRASADVMKHENSSRESGVGLQQGERQEEEGRHEDLSPHEPSISTQLVKTAPEINITTYKRFLCFVEEFEDPIVRHAACSYRRRTNFTAFLISNAFSSALSVLLLVLTAVEDWNAYTSDVSGQLFAGLALVTAVGFAINGAHAHTTGIAASLAHQYVFVVMCVIGFVAVNLARPALVGEGTGYLYFIYCLTIIHIGAPVQLVMATHTLLLILLFSLRQYRRLLYDGDIIVLPCYVAFITTAMAHNKLDLRAFGTLIKKEEALREVHQHDEVRESMHDALVPPVLRRRVTADTIRQGMVDTWGIDECLVIAITIPPYNPATRVVMSESVVTDQSAGPRSIKFGGSGTEQFFAASNPSSSNTSRSKASPDTKHVNADAPVVLHSPNGSTTTSANKSASSPGGSTSATRLFFNNSNSKDHEPPPLLDAQGVREHMEQTSGYLECLVHQTKHRTLHIVRAFGGSIVIAGPLENSKSLPMYKYNVEDAVEDMLSIAEGALQLPSSHGAGGNSLVNGITAGIATEQAINILKLDAFPTFDIVGPAVAVATAIAHAAPTSMVALSDKLVQHYLPNNSLEHLSEGKLEIVSCMPWKLRRWGVLRVHRLALAGSSQLPISGYSSDSSADDVLNKGNTRRIARTASIDEEPQFTGLWGSS